MASTSIQNKICFIFYAGLLLFSQPLIAASCPKGKMAQACKACQKKGQNWNHKRKQCEPLIPRDTLNHTTDQKKPPKVVVPPSADELPTHPQDSL